MKPRAALALLAALACHVQAAPPKPYQFTVIGHTHGAEVQLKQSLMEAGEGDKAFVVATGIKAAKESCSDALYAQRRDLFNDAQRPTIVVPAASDWTDCRNSLGRSTAIERLNRIRELFYFEAASLGQHKLPLTRLSASAKFRSYAEYAQWELGSVMYATMNLPSNNNHYLRAAGRNSEYEDRAVANRNWLARILAQAQRKKLEAIVLFSEGDASLANKQDGFAEVRKLIATMQVKFSGKVLLIDTAPSAEPAIVWLGNMGHLSLGGGTVDVRVTPGMNALFSVEK